MQLPYYKKKKTGVLDTRDDAQTLQPFGHSTLKTQPTSGAQAGSSQRNGFPQHYESENSSAFYLP